jgi:hypothetical protein
MKPCPPVLLIVFNRPNLAAKVLGAIRRQRPAKLYIACDGPRDFASYPHEEEHCRECRNLVKTIDWPCEVFTRFNEVNMGCGRGPSSAIAWFFKNETAGIILEDDCLPADDFFSYCAELLVHYRDNSKVMHICGNNFGSPDAVRACGGFSYGFGRYAQVWGWASWARAWQHFEHDLCAEVKIESHYKILGVEPLRQLMHRDRVLSTTMGRKHDVWDYQWQFAVLKHRGIVACPSVNLISNIGFGDDATHTKNRNSPVAMAFTGKLALPLKHPPSMCESPDVNRIYADHMFGRAWKLRRKLLKSWLRGLFTFKPVTQRGV